MTTDKKRRLLPAEWGGGVGGCSAGLRGGATQGPVGDLRKPSSWRSSTDTSILLAVLLAVLLAIKAVPDVEPSGKKFSALGRAPVYTGSSLRYMRPMPSGIA